MANELLLLMAVALLLVSFRGFIIVYRQDEEKPYDPSLIKHYIYALFSGTLITFYDNQKIIATWKRDRHGNNISKDGAVMNGRIECILYAAGKPVARSYIEFKDNSIADNRVCWSRANGNKYMEYEMLGDQVTGRFRSYHPDGNEKKSVWLSAGRQKGLMDERYSSGFIRKSCQYKDGKKEGTRAMFYDRPEKPILRVSTFIGGCIEGYEREYWQDGALYKETYYRRNIKYMETIYGSGGRVISEKIDDAAKDILDNDEEISDVKRTVRAKLRLKRYGMELFDPQSINFPRARAIIRPGDKYYLREFSCEEELVKFVLGREFRAFVIGAQRRKKGKKIKAMRFNDRGRLVRA